MSDTPSSWRVLGASVAGSGHRKSGRGCDDAHAYRQLDGDLLLLAVADGAGSMPHSAAGAACAVEAALDSAAATLASQGIPAEPAGWEAVLDAALRAARSALETLAETAAAGESDTASETVADATDEVTLEAGDEAAEPPEPPAVPLQQYATTLLVALATPEFVAAAQIGDGAVVMQGSEGTLEVLTVPEHGEYLNETTFVTATDYLERAQHAVRQQPGVRALALLSDGLQMLALDLERNEAFRPFFEPLLAFAAKPEATEAELAAFLDSDRICERTDDDKTLVLAVREWQPSDAATTSH